MISMRKSVRSITRQCVTCRRQTIKPSPQLLGQLPLERVTPGAVFEKVGVDYAGPVYVKSGITRKSVVRKAYISLFVSLAVKAVHIELVSDLTTEAFIATLRRFTARRGYPSLIWSDHGRNFVGASRELKELYQFLNQQITDGAISQFCTARNIEWSFIPERSPHFGGLWEAAVKSAKSHLKRVVKDTKLTFEEMTTFLTQVEACLNSRPLVALNSPDDDGIEALTPGHFLIGQLLCALPDHSLSYSTVPVVQRWNLCQKLTHHFWQRWSAEYLTSLNKHSKWHRATKNLKVGDIVLLKEDTILPTKWPLGKVIHTYPGEDQLVRVVTVKTANGVFKRPIIKVALLLSQDEL